MIGTQMIAKGLDFPGVTLVGVIAADMTLNLPDYRSRERTFQLLTQVAGRAGRGQKSGRVIVQTYRPEDETLTYAARQDFRGFFEAEFLRRRHGLYPPFTVLSRVLIESEKDEIAEQAAEYLESEIHGLLLQHAEWQKKLLLINRSVPSVALLRGKNRRQILMKLLQGTESDEFIGAVTDLLEQTETRAEVRLEVNPVNMI
jgi:primosomal protein N' (replication factor Y)